MVLYYIDNCELCDSIKQFIKENDITIEIRQLIRDNDKWKENIDGGWVDFNKDIHSFPVLKVENSFIIGEVGIKEYLIKGYLYTIKKCPYLNSGCIEEECELFVKIKKNDIIEGGCAVKINTMISLEQLQLREK